MPGLLDYLQAASNAVAGNVSGPVDLINAGLLGMGLPMPQNPVGGSRWMAEKGLTREVPDPYARVVGETAGLLAPTVIAAKAPQIANGLLNHADAYRRYHAATTAPGAPATVWHGSPHKFDKFDSAHIGKGEGAQAYGHGLYFAENPAVAQSYRAAGGSTPAGVNQTTIAVVNNWMDEAKGAGLSGAEAAKWAKQKIHERATQTSTASIRQSMYDAVNNFDDILAGKYGNLYKVDLPDEAIARMLDWDKPLSQQPEAVRKLGADVFKHEPRFDPAYTRGMEVMLEMNRSDPAGVAQALRQRGIPGVRYFDGGSRAGGTGTSNYVVFPGEEGLLKILGRE